VGLIVCTVHAGGTARIGATADLSTLDELLKKWRNRHGDMLPVAVFDCDPALFARVAQVPRLPITTTTARAAELLHRAPVLQDAMPAVLRCVRRLGPKAGPLLHEWRSAVDGLEVAACT